MEVDSYIKKHGSHPFGILPEMTLYGGRHSFASKILPKTETLKKLFLMFLKRYKKTAQALISTAFAPKLKTGFEPATPSLRVNVAITNQL